MATLSGPQNVKASVTDPGPLRITYTPTHILLSANATSTLVPGADAQREVVIQSHPDNTSPITVGGDTPMSADKGLVLSKGQSVTLTTKSAIYAFTAVAGQKVALIQLSM